jgi:hypothetical protein
MGIPGGRGLGRRRLQVIAVRDVNELIASFQGWIRNSPEGRVLWLEHCGLSLSPVHCEASEERLVKQLLRDLSWDVLLAGQLCGINYEAMDGIALANCSRAVLCEYLRILHSETQYNEG